MSRGRYYIIAVLISILPILTSCREELCYDHYPTLDVNFEWELEWERDYGHNHINNWDKEGYGHEYDALRPDMPEWINMVSYYDDGRRSESFMSPDGKSFIVEPGRERSVLFYNGDTEYIVLSDVASLTDARATATTRSRSRASLAAMYEAHQDARTTNPPDVLYSCFVEHVPAIKNHEQLNLHKKMQPLVYTYLINYEFEHGLEYVALARGALGGVAESVYLRTGVTSEEAAIVLYDCTITDKGCQASVHSFGVPGFPDAYYGRTDGETPDRPYSLNLEVMLYNGKTIEFDIDISDQLKHQPRGGVITVKGLRVEDEQGEPNSGFDVDVTDWGENGDIIDLPLNTK